MHAVLCWAHVHSTSTATAKIDGDLMFQLVSWVRWMRRRGRKMTVLGSPFEADAQLVKLQLQGLIDCILSQDGDIILLGATKLQCGKSEHHAILQHTHGPHSLATTRLQHPRKGCPKIFQRQVPCSRRARAKLMAGHVRGKSSSRRFSRDGLQRQPAGYQSKP